MLTPVGVERVTQAVKQGLGPMRVGLLNIAGEVANPGIARQPLEQPRFGPVLVTPIEVSAIALYGPDGARLLTEPIDDVTVLPGQFFELDLSLEVISTRG